MPSSSRIPSTSSQLAAMNLAHASASSATPARSGISSSTGSASGSSSTNSLAPVAGAITMETIMAQHAGAADPKMSALEQALNDRNVLSSQNTQLWKLIEKQRSGYNQILKELERVRGERDSFKTKLGVALSSTPSAERRHRSADRSHKHHPSKSESPAQPSDSSAANGDQNSRQTMTKHYSDEQATPRSTSHNIQSKHSMEPVASSSATESVASSRTSKSVLAPLMVPPRSESLPVPASATNETAPFPTIPHHNHSDSVLSSSSHSSRANNYSRKSSITESVRSISTSTSHSQTPPPQPSRNSPPYQAGFTPQTAPAGFSNTTMYTPVAQQPSLGPSTLSHPLPNPFSPPGPQPHSLLFINNGGHQLSRDSRISLPDEARQYIANMVDSPAPSPKVGAFIAAKSPLVATTGRESPQISLNDASLSDNSKSEFLDLEEDADDEDTIEDQEAYELVQPPKGAPQPLPRAAAVDDFPLPPSSAPAQQQAPIVHQRAGHEPDQLHSVPGSLASMQSYRIAEPELQEGSNLPASFRALPLLSSDLPHTNINVSHSFVRPNDRGKEVLSFTVQVNPGHGKEPWKVEKLYSDVINLDSRVRNNVGKSVAKKMASLPEGKLWKDHAPAKVDQRKAVLQHYLQSLISLPVKNNDEVIAFFTSDIVRDMNQPVMQEGHKEGYLTKRGKNFGGWKTRYFVLQGPVLEYYDCRGGTHLGSISVTGAQIGRQQRTDRNVSTDEEKEYRHAFLIVEAKKGPGGNHPRHVLCAESDADRDSWVEMLVRYFSGTYSEEPVQLPPISMPAASVPQMNGSTNTLVNASASASLESMPAASPVPIRRPVRGVSKDDISVSKGSPIPINKLPLDSSNAKIFSGPALADEQHVGRSASPSKSFHEASPTDRYPSNGFSDAQNARRILERTVPQSSSLPDSSPLSSVTTFAPSERANSELGHYPDLKEPQTPRASQQPRQQSPERHRVPDRERKSFHPSLNAAASPGQSDRVPSPEKFDAKVKISGPLNGAPIPAGYKFGSGNQPDPAASTANDRREKAKSRSFWGFGRPNGGDKVPTPSPSHIPRAVFGVPLEESLDVATIAHLPAIVFRCIQYLESQKADQEEGIYRLSGSSAVIKNLKDMFNAEGDVDLMASDDYWDPHAVAGLLKSFLRELPASILTRELHLRFLAVIDFVDPQERIKELSQLIGSLPIANYSLLRALTAHLILIVQNSSVNKMNMRNVGIVFSPTLGIPAGVFSLMLGEFNRVFNVEDAPEEKWDEENRRNSKQYSDGAADQLLGLSGRTLKAPPEEAQSDGDDYSVQNESGTENDGDNKSDPRVQVELTPETPVQANIKMSKASTTASARGLNVTVTQSERGNRHSRMMGLPTSPRPPPSPRQANPPSPPLPP